MDSEDKPTPPPRKWECEFFFVGPPPKSPILRDVYESLQRRERSRRPIRNIADCIIRNFPTEQIAELITNANCSINDPVTKGLRLLHFAAFQYNEEAIRYLLDLGADPNLMDDVGYTPLHLCAERGYTDLIPLLLQYGARLRFTELNPEDKSYGNPSRATSADEPLRLAIRQGEHETAETLLQCGANPNAAYYLGYEINLVDSLDLRSIELLLQFGADPNARDLQDMTPLMKACRNPEAVETVHLLISYGANPNAMTEEEQRTPLHYAVIASNLELVQILIQNGARVRFPSNYTKPPPHYFAVLRGSVPVLNYLIDSGADVNALSPVVGSALHIALTEKVPNKEEVVKALLEKGANPNAITMSDKGPVLKTPLGEYFQACEQPQLELVHWLLRYGARVVLRPQIQHPLGIIKVIHRLHLGLIPEVMNLVIEASESFCVSFIENSTQMSDEHKQLLLDKALQPFTLKHSSRFAVRLALGSGPRFLSTVLSLQIPKDLISYLLFDSL